MTLKEKTEIKATPLQGGAITVREKPLLDFGAFSMVQNMRGKHPGFEKRKGSAQHNTTTLGSLKCLSLYNFSKGKRTERHLLAQMSDDDVYEATNYPPATGTTFGSAIFTGTATSKPASWANLDDVLLFSNCKDQHQLHSGDSNWVKRFVKYDGAAAPPTIPTLGYDYTQDVTDGQITTFAVLDSLDTYANNECLFICTPVPANKLTWTFVSGKENDTAAVGTLSYWKNDNTWADTTETDGTSKGGTDTLGQDGSMTWTHPTDEVARFMYGYSGFWYRWETATQIDAEVEVSSLTYGSSFYPLQNVWAGIAPYAIEAQFFINADSVYKRFGSDSIEISDMVVSDDKIYFSSSDRIIGIYVDVGETPNEGGSELNSVTVWCGVDWQSVGTPTDGTSGFANSGWITWGRPPYNSTYYPEKVQFQTSGYYAYWYCIDIKTAAASDSVIISITTMPYFDIEEFGVVGYVNAAWKSRAIYNFGDNLGYASAKYRPMTLNGTDFGILEAGDGRANRWVCAKPFYNELLVWQQELGADGGCLTIFEGYSPATWGKVILSSKVGTLNAKSAVVIDGVMTSTRTDEKLKTLAFFISHYGVFVTDGTTVSGISDDIQNYFDPRETATCLTRGAEDENFIFHDTSCNVLRLGLACGPSATTCNVFPVFDLTDWTWSFDIFDDLNSNYWRLSAMCEVEAASGDIAVLQYGGGVDDGLIYRLNVDEAADLHDHDAAVERLIDSYITMEFKGEGKYINLRELLILMETQAAGDVTVTITQNALTGETLTLSMTAENASEIVRRHRSPLNITNQHISIKLQHNTADQDCNLQAIGVKMLDWEKR